jgi:hypothetical protein
LPKHKDKKKWMEIVWEAKLFVQEMWTTVYWRLCLTYKGCHAILIQKILLMFVRGTGIRDITEIEQISIKKVLSVLVRSNHKIKPKRQHL